MSQQNQSSFVVSCPDCRVQKEVDQPNDAIAFYRRHTKLTGHDIEWVHADFEEEDVPTEGDVKAVIETLEHRFEDGVPIGVIAAAKSLQGATIDEALSEIRTLRMKGELYEPKDDHISAT